MLQNNSNLKFRSKTKTTNNSIFSFSISNHSYDNLENDDQIQKKFVVEEKARKRNEGLN
jgi:hypothetical protein